MAQKRKHAETENEPDSTEVAKKAKKGFTVGPDNLPDGTHRRKGTLVSSSIQAVLTSVKPRRSKTPLFRKPKLRNHMPSSKSAKSLKRAWYTTHTPRRHPIQSQQLRPLWNYILNGRLCLTNPHHLRIRMTRIGNRMPIQSHGSQLIRDPTLSQKNRNLRRRTERTLKPGKGL